MRDEIVAGINRKCLLSSLQIIEGKTRMCFRVRFLENPMYIE